MLIRPIRQPDDDEGVRALDRSFTTDTIYRVIQTPLSFTLEQIPVHSALTKEFPFEVNLGDRHEGEHALVTEDGGSIVGFVAFTHERWNRRTALWHLYIAPSHRRQGVGTALVETVFEHARSARTRCVWIETTSIAYPAIQFYRHLGFELCGMDTSLYDPAPNLPGETALFFSRSV